MDLECLFFTKTETSRHVYLVSGKISQHHLRDSLASEETEPEFLSVYRWCQAFHQQNPSEKVHRTHYLASL